jgi:probable F420-dependent oxidoreductase
MTVGTTIPVDPARSASEVGLEPRADDLSAYVQGGRVRSSAQAISDAVDAERLGFRRVFLSERYDLKEAGALLGGMAALTSRLGIATSALLPGSRPPILTAALGATLHSAYGPRFVLGLGRGTAAYLAAAGIRPIGYEALTDYARIVRRLWRGETVDYDGPAGSYRGLEMADLDDVAPPEIWAVVLGGPRACAAAADPVFDGVFLAPFLTPEALHTIVGRLHERCRRIDRDPATLRICQPIVTAPELDDEETRALLHARMVTYLQEPRIGEMYAQLNGWDTRPILEVRNHEQFRDMDGTSADHRFHRVDLLEPAKLVPDAWMYQTSAVGPVNDCVKTLQAFRDAGADELATYGSSPAQNANLIRAWRDASAPPSV